MKKNIKAHSKKSSNANSKTDGDANSLKENLQEFYKNSKEKLLKLKAEVESAEEENEKQKQENERLNLKYGELINNNEQLSLLLKGMKQKIIYAQKNRTSLQNQIKEMKNEVESTGTEIDTMKIDTNYRVKLIQNEIDHTALVKRNSIDSIKEKIQREEKTQKELNDKISEIKEEIEKYKAMTSELTQNDVIGANSLLKETAEMTKFLAEL